MNPETNCTTGDALQRLLLGLGDLVYVVAHEQHLAICPLCAQHAAEIHAEDALVQTIRRVGLREDTPEPAVVSSLVSVFRRLNYPAPITTASWSGSADLSEKAATALRPALAPTVLERVGPYVVRERLGAGGMGEVYRAFDPRLEREVAIKVIRREMLAKPGITERFLAEARAAAAVEHDNIVPVFAVEIHDELPCIVMPVLKGETLEQRLLTCGAPLPVATVARIARQIAEGLAVAHARGRVHRDIKPANVWLESPDDRVRILDFGLAVLIGEGASEMAGTPGYMAPEQIHGLVVDARTDLFGLGCLLYRAATALAPFGSDNATSVLVRTITRKPDSTVELNPRVPHRLGRLIDQLLAKEPAARPESAAWVVAELESIADEAADRRRRFTRRQWLFGIATASVAGALVVGGLMPRRVKIVPLPPPEPVLVEFVTDADLGPVVFTRDEEGQTFDLKSDNKLSLAPGDYQLRPAVVVPGRKLEPDVLTVFAGAAQIVVKLAIVGEVERIEAHSEGVTGVAVVQRKDRFAVLSAGRDWTLNEWVPGSKAMLRHANLNSPALSFAATPDGTIAVTAGGDKQKQQQPGIELWDAVTFKPLGKPLLGHKSLVKALAISADGKVLLSAAKGDERIWDVAKREYRSLDGHEGTVTAAALDKTCKRALTGDDEGRVYLWDLTAAEPKLLKKFPAPTTSDNLAVRAVAFSPTGFVTAGDDRIIRVWDGSTFHSRALLVQSKAVLAIAVSTDGKRLLSGGEDQSVKLWSASNGSHLYTFTGHVNAVSAVGFTPDGRGAVSGGADRTIRLWRLPHE